jgi:hypothetical protein
MVAKEVPSCLATSPRVPAGHQGQSRVAAAALKSPTRVICDLQFYPLTDLTRG